MDTTNNINDIEYIYLKNKISTLKNKYEFILNYKNTLLTQKNYIILKKNEELKEFENTLNNIKTLLLNIYDQKEDYKEKYDKLKERVISHNNKKRHSMIEIYSPKCANNCNKDINNVDNKRHSIDF